MFGVKKGDVFAVIIAITVFGIIFSIMDIPLFVTLLFIVGIIICGLRELS